jgi:hypothetical protein
MIRTRKSCGRAFRSTKLKAHIETARSEAFKEIRMAYQNTAG